MYYIRGYYDKNCRQFGLLTWDLFNGQFVHPVGGDVLMGGSKYFMFQDCQINWLRKN